MDEVNWLIVDLNSYFASVEQQLNPRLRGRPVAVVPMKTDSTCCIAASYEAKAFGVKTGTSVRDARQMCPSIVFIEGNHSHYIEYHHRIIEAIESCHPVNAVLSIDEMSCKLGGRDRDIKNALQLSREIKEKILQVGSQLTSSVGLAPNRFLAKTASDMQKPDGLTVIRQSDLPHVLYPLKLRDLCGIGHNMEVRLNQAGITSIQQLCSQNVFEMRKIWGGIGGEYFYRWLRGEDFNLSSNDNQSVGHSHVLPPPMRNQQKAYAIAQKLLYKAAVRLRRINSWAQRMSLSVRYINQNRWSADLKMLECQDDITLREAFKKLWVQQVKMGSPMKISITLFDLVQEADRTFNFFEDKKRSDLTKALDAINARYGKNSVYFGGVHEAKAAAPVRIAFSNIPDVSD